MVDLISGLDGPAVRANLAEVQRAVDQAAEQAADRRGGRAAPRVLAAVKYLVDDDLPTLHEAGVELVGENRAQQLAARAERFGELFEWHFIGQLQSRKVAMIAPHVTLIHSVASRSALTALERCREAAHPGLRVLIEVNVAGEPGKAGVDAAMLHELIDLSPVPVAGLMTMPPLAPDPEASRPYFAELRRLADARGLVELSMGTSQDFVVGAEEGATIVRIGTSLYVTGGSGGPPSG